jgi:valyl-tRNA synthetase
VIVIPPPNVTSVLHMGHGLNNTLQDVLIRWRRMQGGRRSGFRARTTPGSRRRTWWSAARQEGLTRQDLGREEFVSASGPGSTVTRPRIIEQLEATGCSFDLERERFTLDPGLSAAVREVFVRLYEKNLIYRGHYIINWCPRCLTALSNEEAESEETAGKLYHLRYPFPSHPDAEHLPQLADGRTYLVVATTGRRPCWATPPSRSTRPTSATRGWWGGGWSCRSPVEPSRSSRTIGWIQSSGAAP